MSGANAAAKKRRAPASIEPPSPPIPSPQSAGSNAGLTLPQVIALIDKRLVVLETFVADSKKTSGSVVSRGSVSFAEPAPVPLQPASKSVDLDEFNTRFNLLADEIANMKNIVLSLQSYTMDVNKVLMEERVKILSEVSNEQSGPFSFTGNESFDGSSILPSSESLTELQEN